MLNWKTRTHAHNSPVPPPHSCISWDLPPTSGGRGCHGNMVKSEGYLHGSCSNSTAMSFCRMQVLVLIGGSVLLLISLRIPPSQALSLTHSWSSPFICTFQLETNTRSPQAAMEGHAGQTPHFHSCTHENDRPHQMIAKPLVAPVSCD